MSPEDEDNLGNELSYAEIHSGDLGHIEVVQIHFDANLVSYENLCQFFYTVHDPTTWGHQGPDIGQKYASTIFTHNTQ